MTREHLFIADTFRLDIANGCLWQGDTELRLPPKVFAVLCYLIGHRGRVVTKEELFRAVWPDTVSSASPL